MNGKEFLTVSKSTLHEFGKDDVAYLAAALTYYSFFSLFPLVLLAGTLVALFFKPADAYNFIFTNVGQFAPGLVDFLTKSLVETISNRNNAGWSALIGVVTLLITATGAFDALDKSVNRAWNSEKVPTLLVGKLTSFAMMLVVAGLLVVSIVISTVLTSARAFTTMFIGDPLGSQVIWAIVNFFGSGAVIFLGFLLLYRFIPRSHVSFRDVYLAALLASFVWSLAKEVFALYLGTTFANFSAVYGTVGAVIALLTWIYVSSLIILTGVEFASETTRVRSLRAKIAGEGSNEGKSNRRRSPWLSQ